MFVYSLGTPLTPLGFSAYLSDTSTYKIGQQLLFAGTVTNVGNHYQVASSLFICPVDGLYAFSSYLVSDGSGYPDVGSHILLEGIPLTSIKAHASNDDQGQAFCVTSCYAGERVWVENYLQDTLVQANYGTGEKFSSFNGFLIKAF